MSADGYRQAVQNVAWEINRLADDIANMGGTLAAKALSVMTRSDPVIAGRAAKLDHIIEVIAQTYSRDLKEVERDVDKACDEYSITHKTGEKP